jgi:chromosome partitioning protein
LSTPVIAFFNNKGGVGKTSLVYHLAWMYSDLGIRVVAADLDPQANLTAAFLEEDRLEELWPDGDHPLSVFGSIQPLLRGIGDIADAHLEHIEENLGILVGDLWLSSFEDELSSVWPDCMDRKERAFRVISAFWRVMQNAALNHQADIILMDLGPNLGAINRAALISANYVVVPLSPDLFSLQGLRNLGPTLRRWREEWNERIGKNPVDLKLPSGSMKPVGYIVMQHSVRLDRPVKAYDRWIERIPDVYRNAVLGEPGESNISVGDDPHCLALLKHYRSLMPLAQEAHKPMFHLKPADGAIGAHVKAVGGAKQDFDNLAKEIARRTEIGLSYSVKLTAES